MHAEQLFTETLTEIANKVVSNNDYDILTISSLLRKLYLDDTPLVHLANKSHKHKIRYKINKVDPPDDNTLDNLKIWMAADEILPDPNEKNQNVIEINESQLLSTIIVMSEGNTYTIKDTIKHVANVMGGVHPSTPKNQWEHALHQLTAFAISDLTIILYQLKAIAKIILVGLKELYQKILSVSDFIEAEGLTVYINATILPLRDKNNFIFDFGVEESRERIFAYIDSRSQLCFRFYDSNGNYYLVNAGYSESTYYYGKATTITFEIAILKNKLLISIELGFWRYIKIYNVQTKFIALKHHVLGSNYNGKEESKVLLTTILTYAPTQSIADKEKTNHYMQTKLQSTKVIKFDNGRYLASAGHPNFPKGILQKILSFLKR